MRWGKDSAIEPVESLVRMAELANVDRDPDIKEAILAAGVSGNANLVQDLSEVMRVQALQEVLRDNPYRIPSPHELYEGLDEKDLALLGVVLDADVPFFYPLDWLNSHAYIGGGSGTGKTNFLYGLALQTMQHCPVWIFDRDKQDYRHLLRLNEKLLVVDVQEDLAFNPLEVAPGVKPKDWLTAFVTIFCKSNALLDGSEALLLKAMYGLYEDRGIFSGSTDYPTLFDLLEKVRRYTFRRFSREAGYQDSIINRLESYLIACPKTYGYSRGFSISELAQKSLVIEVKGLSERHARCLMNWLLYALFLYRIANAQRGNVLRNLVIIDEGKYAFPAGYNANIGFSPIAALMAQARETGIGVAVADQTAQLDECVFVQSRLKIAFRMGSGEDIQKVRKTFALSKEQAEFIPRLDVGRAIIRVPKIDPFLVRIPKVRLG